jgi:hypothetical protein
MADERLSDRHSVHSASALVEQGVRNTRLEEIHAGW